LRTGKNPKMFNKIESIVAINKIQPLVDGGRNNKLKIEDKDKPSAEHKEHKPEHDK
jgi:hypothetical protein